MSSNKIGNEAKQVGDSARADAAHCETNQKPGRFANRKHEANVGVPASSSRVQQARKEHHGANAEPGRSNDDGRTARASNQPHTNPNVPGQPFIQRPPVNEEE